MNDMNSLHIGIDIGSTTLKIVVLDHENNVVFDSYLRHLFDVKSTISHGFQQLKPILKGRKVTCTFTGSAAMQFADEAGLPHLQEVLSAVTAIREHVNERVNAAVEIGGEDTKLIYLNKDCEITESRMNSQCAAGTGAFLDNMAALLETDALGLDDLAKEYTTVYPIASRCGVFAKSDVQPMLAEGIPKADIAASIFHAVATQCVSGLSMRIESEEKKVAFLGGPLHFLPQLRNAFTRILKLKEKEVIIPSNAHLIMAIGAAIHSQSQLPIPFEFLENRFEKETQNTNSKASGVVAHTLEPLFKNEQELCLWRKRHCETELGITRISIDEAVEPFFLGLDSGSTTTKCSVIDSKGRIIHDSYSFHQGDTMQGAMNALKSIDCNLLEKVKWCTVTGYGEPLLTAALRADSSIVETIAHLRAAKHLNPKTEFVLDIGGQDMKAIHVDTVTNVISEVYLNESCSSGCGTFIQTLASSLNISISEFAKAGLKSKAPLDLGTRCTVFMNSRIKQAQKDGATLEDISAGLAMSIIKNALFKVMKLRGVKDLGDHVLVQGGTFLNESVLRAIEVILDREVTRPPIAGLMGAFGAALEARSSFESYSDDRYKSRLLSHAEIEVLQWNTFNKRCGKCTNNCLLTVHEFNNGDHYITGNRCEKGLGITESTTENIPDLMKWQRERVFSPYKPLSKASAINGVIGIPRVLGVWEEYPFWFTLFTSLGFRVIISPESSDEIYRLGIDTMPDESVCNPVKLVHGHLEYLAQKGCKNIFIPAVLENIKENCKSNYQYNCSLLSGYAEIVKNNMDLERRYGIRLIHSNVALGVKSSVIGSMHKALSTLVPSLTMKQVETATNAAYTELSNYKNELKLKGEEALEYMNQTNTQGVVIACRPYHLDPLMTSAISPMLKAKGYCVITADSIAHLGFDIHEPLESLNLFVYDERVISAAKFITKRNDLSMVHLLSFGCAISPATDDECKTILRRHNRPYCSIKIDQNTSIGSIRVRILSLLAAMKDREGIIPIKNPCISIHKDDGPYKLNGSVGSIPKEKTLLVFPFSPVTIRLWLAAFNKGGYKGVCISPPIDQVHEVGLEFANPDLCEGVNLALGRYLIALRSGDHDVNNTDIMWLHYGGSCRAVSMGWHIQTAVRQAGFTNVNVHSIDFAGRSNPGVSLVQNLWINAAMTISDILQKMLLRTRPYESVKGSANSLYNSWMDEAEEFIENGLIFKYKAFVREMVADFDALELCTEERDKPRVGVAGLNMQDLPDLWRITTSFFEEEHGCELTYFNIGDYGYLPAHTSQQLYKEGIDPDFGVYIGTFAHKFFINLFRNPANDVLSKSKRFEPSMSIEELFEYVKPFLAPCSALSGEGWLPLAQMCHHLEHGINNIVATVPFGCLSSHLTARGMHRKLRELYPQANVVQLDCDPGQSYVNLLNRIKLMVECMQKDEVMTQEVVCRPSDIEDFGTGHCSTCSNESDCIIRTPIPIQVERDVIPTQNIKAKRVIKKSASWYSSINSVSVGVAAIVAAATGILLQFGLA